MRKTELQKRLIALETSLPSDTQGALSETHPRVIAVRKMAMSQLSAKLEELKTGVPEWERLDAAGRVRYWRQKVAEAKFAIANDGKSRNDDIEARGVVPGVHKSMNALRLRISREELPELLANLAAATREAKSH